MQLRILQNLINLNKQKRTNILLCATVVLFSLCGNGFTAPVISSLEIENGIVAGSGFGLHPDNSVADADYLCVAFDNFDTGVHTTKFADTFSSFYITTEYIHSGTYSIARHKTDESVDGLKIIGKETNDGFYTFFNMLVPLGTEANSTANHKTVQVRDPTSNHTPHITLGIIYAGLDPDKGIFSIYGTGEGYMESEYFDTVDLRDGKWHSVETWFKPCSNGTTDDGELTVIIDNKICYASTTLDTYDNVLGANTYNEDWGIMTFIRGFNKDQFFDNVFFDCTQARVVIGNNPVFTSCTHREIQIPTAWSDTEITITINQGSFNAGEQVYLFVIDSDGNASDGYPITIGGTSLNVTGSLNITGSITTK